MQYSKFRNRGENSRSENSNPNGRKRTYTKENYFCFLRDEIGKNSVFPPAFSTAQKQNNTKIVHRVEAFTFHCSFSLVLNMAARPQRWGGEGEMLGLEIICTVPPLSSHHSPPPQLQGMVTRSNWQDNLVFDVKITLLSLHILCTQNWFMFLDRFRNHLKTYVK